MHLDASLVPWFGVPESFPHSFSTFRVGILTVFEKPQNRNAGVELEDLDNGHCRQGDYQNDNRCHGTHWYESVRNCQALAVLNSE